MQIKPLQGLEDRYEVHWDEDTGFVGVYSLLFGKYIKCHPNKNGYYCCKLYRGGRKLYTSLRRSRIFASAFVENPHNKPFVDHIDRNPANDDPRNLRWVTRSENNYNRAPWGKGYNKHNASNKWYVWTCRSSLLFDTEEEAIEAVAKLKQTKLLGLT